MGMFLMPDFKMHIGGIELDGFGHDFVIKNNELIALVNDQRLFSGVALDL